MRYDQVNSFLNGVLRDIDDNSQAHQALYDAINVDLKEEFGALVNMQGTTNLSLNGPSANYVWIAAFPCSATYGASKTIRPSILLFSRNTVGTTYTDIQIFDSINEKLYLIYSDASVPTPRATTDKRIDYLEIGDEVDAFMFGEGNQFWAYWLDNVHPLRHIKLHVQDDTVYDNSVAGKTPLYIANEPDCLLVQRLWPVDELTVDSVTANSGNVKAGACQFAYRYYNSTTGQYSQFSLFTNPVMVFDNPEGTMNSIEGNPPGVNTGKSITLETAKKHFHSFIYDSIQLAVVKRAGLSNPEIVLLPPSTEWYGTVGVSTQFTYFGTEKEEETTVLAITVDDAELLTGKTLEEKDGRLYLMNITYWDLDFDLSDHDAETIVEELDVNADPMADGSATNQGFYDEMNCHNYTGFWRDEVYRFAQSYVNKFGMWARPKVLDMTDAALQYNPADHANTWQLNHAASGIDWKFLSRQSAEGCIIDTVAGPQDVIRPIGINISNITEHPLWAYGLGIFREPRRKKILGQSPLVHCVGVQGNAHQVSQNAGQYSPLWFIDPAQFDEEYGGEEDCYMPKILAMGAAKNLINFTTLDTPTATPDIYKYNYLRWVRALYGHTGAAAETAGQRNNLVMVYPLEYMANLNGEEISGIDFNGDLGLQAVDMVMLQAFNAYRDSGQSTGYPSTGAVVTRFTNGYQSRYIWVFAPSASSDYFYNATNTNNPNTLITAASGVNLANTGTIDVLKGAKLGWGHSPFNIGQGNGEGSGMSHITWFNNVFALATQNTLNSDTLWPDLDSFAPHPVTNQRGMLLFLNPDWDVDANRNTNYIYDPFVYLDSLGAGLAGLWATLGAASLDPNGTLESLAAATCSIANIGTATGDYDNNVLIQPGTYSPFWIVNIQNKLGDDRYGTAETSSEFIFTGAYTAISGAEVSGGTPQGLDVWGGDCFITRNIINIRDNAPRKVKVNLTINYPAAGTLVDGGSVTDLTRTTTFDTFTEVMDVWVESSVNGHLLFRNRTLYPNGIATRDATNIDVLGNPVYKYPVAAPIEKWTTPNLYLYNHGYSAENDIKKWYSKDLRERLYTKNNAIVHFSNQKVINSNVLGFDRWLTNDYFQLNLSMGPGTKLSSIPNRAMYAIQENGVALLMLGQTLTQDTSGFELYLSSGAIIGYALYLDDNVDTAGDFGGQHLRAIKKGGGGLFVFDAARENLLEIQGQSIKSVSHRRNESLINNFVASYLTVDNNFVMWYDNIDERIGVYRNRASSYGAGISYLAGDGRFEGRYRHGYTAKLIEVIVSGNKKFYIYNRPTGKIDLQHTGAVRNVFMGLEDYVSEFTIILNGGKHIDQERILSLVSIQADNPPTSIRAYTRFANTTYQNTGTVVNNTLRRRQYIYNILTDTVMNVGSRLRDKNIRVEVTLDNAAKIVVSSVTLTYRLDTRNNNQ